ncbi:hypothetical protein [uncultured Desulfuromonas sp.]|nr:hypothetical protein [uncultured Desulfuromonas sp.]
MLNNTLQQGGHRPTRFIGAMEEIKQDGNRIFGLRYWETQDVFNHYSH